jgi:hypothetical protein
LKPINGYYFKIYFEKLTSIEIVDIIEGESKSGGVSYWNFYGVEVNVGENQLKPLFRSQKLLPKKNRDYYKFNGKGDWTRNQRTSSRKKMV